MYCKHLLPMLLLLCAGCGSSDPPPPAPAAGPAFVATAPAERREESSFLAVELLENSRTLDEAAFDAYLAEKRIASADADAWRAARANRWDDLARLGRADVLRRSLRSILGTAGMPGRQPAGPVLKAYLSVASKSESRAILEQLDQLRQAQPSWWNEGGEHRAQVRRAYEELCAWVGEHPGAPEAAALGKLAALEGSPELAKPAAKARERMLERLAARRRREAAGAPRVAVEIRVGAWRATRFAIEPALQGVLAGCGFEVAAADAADVDALATFDYEEAEGPGYEYRSGGAALRGTVARLHVTLLDLRTGKSSFETRLSCEPSNVSEWETGEDRENKAQRDVVEMLLRNPDFKTVGLEMMRALREEK